MSFIIRKGGGPDMPQVLVLIKELATFEKEPDAVFISETDLIRDGFGDMPLFKTFVAELDEKIVGMALFYPRYSTWKGQTIHLEDLIVQQSHRGLGIGKALYTELMKYAYQKKVKRIEWVVLDWNTPALNFYKSTGATILTDWHLAQMDEKALESFINKN